MDGKLARVLAGEAFLVFDGGMGTMLQRRGLAAAGAVPDLLCLTDPDAVTDIHAAYVAAGAEVITTNTFGSNSLKLEGRADVAEVYHAATACARAAGARYVAGDMGPVGALLEPLGTLSFDEAYRLFAEQARAIRDAGCDLIAIETISDLREAKAALLAAKDCGGGLPVSVSMTFGEDGRTFLGTTPRIAAVALSSMGADVVGVNCSLGPDELLGAVQAMAKSARCPVIAQPNAGLPQVVDGQTVYNVDAAAFAGSMERLLDAGASVIGGCCGTDPSYIERLAALAAARGVPAPRPYRPAFCVTSAQEAVCLAPGRPAVAVIGERINPTGKPRLRQALAEGNLDYLVGEAVAQQQAGADILDVNVGAPGLDEPAVLAAAVEKLQATVTLPLQVDSSDPAAVKAAVRGYAGKPLINSVNGKRESLQAVLPLAKRYGCAVVGLTLDEEGIPPTAEGRLAIAERIVAAAEELGIPRCDVAIDCLAMAAATGQREAYETLRAIALVKERLGVRTVLGVSNVSFGLPQRGLINATYLAAALGAGLDLPILNPLAPRYRDTVAAFRALNGQDAGAAAFIDRYAQADDPYGAARAGGSAGTGPATGGAQAGAPAQGAAAADGMQGTTAVGGTPAQGPGGNMGAGHGGEAVEAGGAAGGGTVPAPHSPVPVPAALADAAGTVGDLAGFILSGRAQPAAEATERLLEGHAALDVIDGVFIPALDEVGNRYERGEFFLPQLMAAAEAVKAGFDVARAHTAAAQGTAAAAGTPAADAAAVGTSKGAVAAAGSDKDAAAARPADLARAAGTPAADRTVLLATVRGDIHDIGKNIVRMLLENYGYRVVDLGRDVPPEDIVRTVREQGIRLVGLSALMTTTVKAMEDTIALLRKQAPGVAVLVGGAVLTPEYAAAIGADFYGKDAAETARIVGRFFADAPA